MLVALTGASGFIGSYTAKSLHARGHQIRALVRKTSRRDHIAPYVTEFLEGDISNRQALAGLVANGVECIIHNGADWDALSRSPETNFQNNVLASLQLLEAPRLADVPQIIFV